MPEKIIKKNKQILTKLLALQLDFNDIFILECFKNQEDMEFFNMLQIPSIRDFNFTARYQTLRKMEYLIENPSDTTKLMLSVKGEDLLDLLSSTSLQSFTSITVTSADQQEQNEGRFEEWWKTYPTTCSWTSDDKAVKFVGSRNLKNLTKAAAKKRYLKLLNQGLKHEELLGSLKYEIKLKKADSIKKNANQMEYFKGMESYFNQERYLLHMEDYRNNKDFVDAETKSKKSNVKDI